MLISMLLLVRQADAEVSRKRAGMVPRRGELFSGSMPVHLRNMVVGGQGSLTKMDRIAPGLIIRGILSRSQVPL
jgi:hypothetical protein